MDAMQFKLDNTANNLANAATTAFKRQRVNFEDLYYQHFRLPGMLDNQSQYTATGVALGLGTRVNSTQQNFIQGSLNDTGNTLDVAIVGDGFFQVQDGNQFLYTRAGNFSLNQQGQVIMTSADRGRLLEPAITIPQDATQISINQDGFVYVMTPGNSQLQQVGQIQLVRYQNPQGLLAVGENLFQQTDASGQPLQSVPGQNGVGVLRQGFLELSNVEPVTELVDLITTQRTFELNSQVMQSADQTLQTIANLRRY
jgi:flagellar basal-body rod protein FlgG